MTLLADVSHPGSQEDLVSNWKPTHVLVKDAISGAEIAPCLPALAVACLSLCLRCGEQPFCSLLALLWCLLNPLFCEWARLHLRLELFVGKFSFSFSFFLSGHSTVWVAISYELTQIVLSTFRPGPYPKHATNASLSSPCLLVVDTSVWATSPLGAVVRHVFCGIFFSSSWLCCPLRFQNSPQFPDVRGFPAFWKLLLQDSLPRIVLHP